MHKLSMVYITFPSQGSAQDCVQKLLAESLIACAHISTIGQSYYSWDGVDHADDEVIVHCKTLTSAVKRAVVVIKALHPYECPCVLTWPIESGLLSYSEWVESKVQRLDDE